jgi:hypothetical protein
MNRFETKYPVNILLKQQKGNDDEMGLSNGSVPDDGHPDYLGTGK